MSDFQPGLPLRLVPPPRRRIVELLRARARTVPELAAALQVSSNAIRGHLAALGRDGLVSAGTTRRDGVGKPPTLYGLTAAAEELFPRAYADLMLALLEQFAEWDGPEGPVDVMREVGARRARALDPSVPDPLACAAAVLAGLGADGVAENGAQAALVVAGCPLAARVVAHPELCEWMAALVAGAAGAPATAHCDRSEGRPRCRFTLAFPVAP